MDNENRNQPQHDSIERDAAVRSWWKNNWMAFVMFIVVVLTQVWNGTDWLHARTANEQASKADIQRLEAAMQALNTAIPNTYVRQDVFTQVLIQIRDRLNSLDNKKDRDNNRDNR